MSPDQNPYEFIMDPSQQKKSMGSNFAKNPNKRTTIAIIFVVIMLVFIFAGYSLITSLNKQDNAALANVAAYQTEIIRVSDLGLLESTDPNTRAKLVTLRAFVTTDLSQLDAFVKSAGAPFTEVQIASKKDAKIDTALESASQRNSYDAELISTLDNLNEKYKASLSQAINEPSDSAKRKTVLGTAAENIVVYDDATE